ncbi:UNVERIFIED_CONTAM: hypothetical protein RMT77_013268 [Armadillidium vulgare]
MELRVRAVCVVILMMSLQLTKGDCPWPREEPSSSPLNSACLCAFNSKNEYSVQCSSVNFPLLMGSLHGRAKNVAFDLLYVNNSEIRELKDRAFLGLQIRNLQISFSEISNISSRAFEGLENTLENLNLQDNHLKEVPTAALSLLQTLNLLDLSGNLLQRIPDFAFQGSNINTLKLSRNVLSLAPEAFKGLESSLKNLNMKGCQLKEVPLAVKRLTSLAFLDLAQNDVRTVDIGILDPMDSLTALNLERNLLQDLEAEVFRGVSDTLSSLSLLNNLLTKFPVEAINSLPQLRVLDIGFNLITKLPSDAFSKVNSLTLLAVDGNPLATIPEEVFKHLNGTLRGLSLGGHYMKCDCRIAWIIKWIKEFDLQVTSRDRDPQFCGQPEILRSKSFYQIEEDELICQELPEPGSNPSSPNVALEPDISPSRPDIFPRPNPKPSEPPRPDIPPKPEFKLTRPGVALPDVIDSKDRENIKKESGSRLGVPDKVPERDVPKDQSEMNSIEKKKEHNMIPPPPKIGAPIQELTSEEPSVKSSRPTTYSPLRPIRPPKAPKGRPNPTGEVEVQDLNPSFTRKVEEAKRKYEENENEMRNNEEAKGGFSREQYSVSDRHPSIVRRPPERPKNPDEFGTSKEDVYGKEVIVQDAYWDSNSINIQWDSETSNILGFRVVYRLFGDKYFKMGQPLAPSSREFKIKNVPPDEYFVACVVSLEEMDIKLESVPFGQCREIRTGDANAQLSTHMDKIIIAASASICGTVIVAVVIFICCFRGKNKKEAEKQSIPAVINPSSPPLASLGALNNSKGDWDTISMYSQRSIPRARMYHHMDKDDARSHASQMSSKSRPRSLADGQSQRSFSGMSGVHLPSAAHVAAHAAQFASPLSLSRPDLRLSRQSLAHPQFGAGYPHFSNGGLISRATSQRSERRRSSRSKSRERTNSRLSHAGSSHSLTGYDTDGWTDHDMDIYMARNPTRGGLVQL